MRRPLTYAKAGVSLARADRFVKKLSRLARTTHRPGLVAGVGGFAGLFRPQAAGRGWVWAASSDGVGTKVLLASSGKYRQAVGTDLVAMNVNDCLAAGAQPVIFLDYYASARLRIPEALSVMRGIVRGCRKAGCTLLGGETAEMPGLYRPNHFDLAGFCLGVVRPRTRLWGPPRAGDTIIGLASSGPHANGFSLIRKLYGKKRLSASLKNQLMQPTAIYVRPVLDLLGRTRVRALVHVTGGGWQGNIPRVLPPVLRAQISLGSWPVPKLFEQIQRDGRLSRGEMFSTFNMGVGMLVFVPAREAAKTLRFMKGRGVRAWQVGQVLRKRPGEDRVTLVDKGR